MQWMVTLLIGIGAFSLLVLLLSPRLPFHQSVPGTMAPWAMDVAPCCVVLLLIILYGQGTACPSCREWWARTKVGTEFVDREVYDRNGVPFGKSLVRTTYQCAACRHRWLVMHADEYREPRSDPGGK
jgi:hypothetical protein